VKGLSNVPLTNRLTLIIGLCTSTCRSLYMPQTATTLISYMQRSGSTDQRSHTHVVPN